MYKIRRRGGWRFSVICLFYETLKEKQKLCDISGFRRHVEVICPFLEYYAAQTLNSVLTFGDNLRCVIWQKSADKTKILKLFPLYF
jgi:hypothetical protein